VGGRRQDRLRDRRERRSEEARAAQQMTPGPSGPRGRRPGVLDRFGGLPVVGAIAAAVLIVFVLIWLNRPSDTSDTPYVPVERSMAEGRVEGDPNAPLLMIDISDFQCVHCRNFVMDTHPTLLDEYVNEGVLAIQFHHLPVLGDESVRAAEAAECALDQGRFWEMHDILFQRQGPPNSGAFSDGNLRRMARDLQQHYPEFDVDAFSRCLDSGEKRGVIEEMARAAGEAGIQSTPSFILNGQLIPGAQPIEVFREVIAEQLGERQE
jgi:protein-disulfide isomerase